MNQSCPRINRVSASASADVSTNPFILSTNPHAAAIVSQDMTRMAGGIASSSLRCGLCGRVFNKPEHLRRHSLIHTKATPHRCAICHRGFARPDTLSRHARIHDPTPTGEGEARHAKPTARGINGGHTTTEVTEDQDSIPPDVSSQQNFWNPVTEQDSFEQTPSLPLPMAQPNWGQLDLWQLLSSDTLPGAQSFQTSPGLFDTLGFDTNLFLERPNRGDTSQHTSSFVNDTGEISYSGTVQESREGTTQTSNSFQMASGGSASMLSTSVTSGAQSHSEQAVHEAQSMVSDLSSRTTAAVGQPSLRWLESCLRMFWTRFNPLMPILHSPTFVLHDTCAPLLLNMVAIGSLFLHSPDSRAKGVAVWRLVHKAVAGSWDRLIALSGPHDERAGTPLLLTAVLGQIYAMLSNNEDLINTSVLFHGLGFRWAKLAGLCDSTLPLDLTPDLNNLERSWQVWSAREVQKRALLAHYLIDGQLISLSQAMPTVRHTNNPLTGAADDRLFAADSATDWHQRFTLMGPSDMPSIASMYDRILLGPDGTLPEHVISASAFTRAVVLEGILARVTEGLEASRVGLTIDSPLSAALALGIFYRDYILRPTSTDKPLLIRWHSVCIATTLGLAQQSTNNDNGTYRRRALLHANAIRQIVKDLPMGSITDPPISLPTCVYDAAQVILDQVLLVHLGDQITPTVSLDEVTDWIDMGSLGLPTLDAESALSSTHAHTQFVRNDGLPCMGDRIISTSSTDSLLTALEAMGRIWTRCRAFLEQLQSRLD